MKSGGQCFTMKKSCKAKIFNKFLLLSMFLLFATVCCSAMLDDVIISNKKAPCIKKIDAQQKKMINTLTRIEDKIKTANLNQR